MSSKPETTESSANNNKDDEKKQIPLKERIKTRSIDLIESTRRFIYDPEHQTIFGNTSSSWLKISVYYFFFYICLGLFYSGMIAVFGAIISRETPTYLYKNNQMNNHGQVYLGMGFRPMPVITDTSITVYNDTASQNVTTTTLNAYRAKFLTQSTSSNVQDCSPTEPASTLQTGYSCRFSWTDIVSTDLHPCSEQNIFGWATGQPCMLIKLNKVYGWTPAAGSVVDKVATATGQPVLSVDQRANNIYITCNGLDAVDVDAIGNLTYYSLLHPLGNPNYGGIPYYFFPYTNSPDYVEPFVLVQFTSLPLFRLVNVKCLAWAPNIQQLSEGTTLRGAVLFNLYRSSQAAPANN